MTQTLVLCLFLVQSGLVLAQEGKSAAHDPEQRDLSTAISEAGSSPVELTRALEGHLEKYPKSAQRVEIEKVLAKAAVEMKDSRRTLQYGEKVLEHEQNDLQLMDRVVRALLETDAKEPALRAKRYTQQMRDVISSLDRTSPPGRMTAGQWGEELDRWNARIDALEARATGNAGEPSAALQLAKKSVSAYPTAEGAREAARWLIRLKKEDEAIQYLADAFTVIDGKNSDADRAKDRQRLGELYRQLHGSEKGLGEIVLASWDRMHSLIDERRQKRAAADPNFGAVSVFDYTLSGLNGSKLKLDSLKGKALVLDFWATWCRPCRTQYPLYEEVRKRFKNNAEVVFLSVNTDEDRSLVEPFLGEQKWSKNIYFEDGLSDGLKVDSIPTTIVVNRKGEISSRMNGFVPDRFVDMLSDRIKEALR